MCKVPASKGIKVNEKANQAIKMSEMIKSRLPYTYYSECKESGKIVLSNYTI